MTQARSCCRVAGALLAVITLSARHTLAASGAAEAPAFKPPFSVSVSDKPLLTEADIADVPVFQVRARVTSCKGGKPSNQRFTFALGSYTSACGRRVTVTGDAWTDWLTYDRKLVRASTLGHLFSTNYPVELDIMPVAIDLPAVIELEAREQEGAPVRTYSIDLFSWGVALRVAFYTWRDKENRPHFMLRKEFNQPYWDWCQTIAIPEGERPKLFPIMIQGTGYHHDSDRFVGLAYMAGLGITMPSFPNPVPEKEDLLQTCGLHRIVARCSRPPLDFADTKTLYRYQAGTFLGKRIWGFGGGHGAFPDSDAWAHNTITPYLEMGFKPQDIAICPESKPAVWSYPAMFQALLASPVALRRFRDYIKAQGLTPQDVGAANWDQLLPLGRSQAVDLPARRRFYWTMRFFAWDSARFSAEGTRALEKAAGPNPPAFVSWDCPFYENRLYYPGPSGANPEKTSRDAARGGRDLLEFGRLRGSTMLFAPPSAGSFPLAQVRCAAEKGGVQFGGVVRSVRERDILLVIGSGGKALRYGVPIGVNEHATYLAYTQDRDVPAKMAEVNRMIGKAEDLLWPGKMPRPEVAILAPRSAQLWDQQGSSTPGYRAEESNVYRALRDANVPVDFVEEDDLSPTGLEPYKVLYVTEPNIPAEFQKGLVAWVQSGGTLAMSLGAGAADRYNDPCDILADGLANAGRGRVVRFTWKPGSFSAAISDQMIGPVRAANVVPPVTVDRAMIETPLLLSAKGAAVTLLNWSGQEQKELKITAQVPFTVKSLESVKQGNLSFRQTEQGVTCTLPLGEADILLLRP